MASYLYYECNLSPLKDTEYDDICRELLIGWDTFEHQHKHLVTIEDLQCGSGFAIREYPLLVKSSAHKWMASDEVCNMRC